MKPKPEEKKLVLNSYAIPCVSKAGFQSEIVVSETREGDSVIVTVNEDRGDTGSDGRGGVWSASVILDEEQFEALCNLRYKIDFPELKPAV